MSKLPQEQRAVPEVELINPLLTQENDSWTASYQGLTLKTALQPIFSIAHKRIIGYEALVRAFDTDQAKVLPIHLFQLPQDAAENLFLDRLCRYLHVQNYSTFNDPLNWLFLNISPQVIANGRKNDSFFGNLLEKTGLPAHRVVMEIVEQPTDDAELLKEAVRYYQDLGCLTAIDDFGAGHSNFERIWNLSPDIVKLDRALLTRATNDRKARQILNGIVSLLHQSGCLVLLEGVETRDQAMVAIDAGVNFVQGFYFCHPSTELLSLIEAPTDIDALLDDYKQTKRIKPDPSLQIIAGFSDYFLSAVRGLRQGMALRTACESLLAHPAVSRCYQIDPSGVQIEHTVVTSESELRQDPRFRPLENTSSSDWFRQNYLKQALAQPDMLQVTSPYLSITGVQMCVTLSLAYDHHGQQRVLCCDLLANHIEGI